MPIEFDCPECNGRLRTPDGSEGQQARCPQCQAVVLVPANAAGAEISPPFATSDPHHDGTNPYAAPQMAPPTVPRGTTAAAGSTDAADILSSAWAAFQNAPWLMVGASLVLMATGMVFNVINTVLNSVAEAGGADVKAVALVALIVSQCIASVVQLWLQIGQVKMALQLARGQGTSFATLFSGANRLLPVVGGFIVMTLAMSLVAILLAVPAILSQSPPVIVLAVVLLILLFVISSLWWWPFYYLIVDGKAGPLESFGVAVQLTRGHRVAAIALSAVTAVLYVLGFFAMCVGLLVAVPVVSLLWAVFYLRLIGEPTATAHPQ